MAAWLLTSTFYGNWLPGDPRGFVGRVRENRAGDNEAANRHVHNQFSTPYDKDMPGLQRASAERMRGDPVLLNQEQANALLKQFQETARFRDWELRAVAIMANHIHIVVETDDDTDPTKVLADFKAYGGRILNKSWGKPAGGTWWTSKGSKRRLADENAERAAIRYVLNQHDPLVVWCHPDDEN